MGAMLEPCFSTFPEARMRTRSLAGLLILLSCNGCALGAAGVAADVLAGASVASLTVSGKGLGDQAISAAAGQDCRLFEGMVRSDRGVCEEYKTAAQRPAYRVEFAAPPMPEIAVGQPMMAQPAMLPAAKPTAQPAMLPAAQPNSPPAAAPPAADPPAPAQPVLAAAKEEHGAGPDARTAAATPEGTKAAKPTKAVAEKAAVVMEADDSMKLNFGDGRSDAAVLAQLQAAIATWRQEVDQPAPAAPAPAEPSPEAAQPPAPDHPAEQ
jgi:hypothetical protein